jgi:hypothetical protein
MCAGKMEQGSAQAAAGTAIGGAAATTAYK